MRLLLIGSLFLAALLSFGEISTGPTSFVRFVGVAEAAGGGAQAPGAAAIPRTRDGKPELSGIWQAMNTAAWDIQDHSAQKSVPAGPRGGESHRNSPSPPAPRENKRNQRKP